MDFERGFMKRSLMTPEQRKRQGETLRLRFANGELRSTLTPEACSKGGRTVSALKLRKNREIAKAKRGKPNPPGPSAAGVGHWRSKFWVLIDPNGNTVFGMNLNEIARRNSRWFSVDDLKFRRGSSRASNGLNKLFRVQNRYGVPYIVQHYRGWRAGESYEPIKNVQIPPDTLVMLKPKIPN